MGSSEDMGLLGVKNVDAAELMSGWHYYLHNSQPGWDAAGRADSASSISRYYLECIHLASRRLERSPESRGSSSTPVS
jgi:hypothetical protein